MVGANRHHCTVAGRAAPCQRAAGFAGAGSVDQSRRGGAAGIEIDLYGVRIHLRGGVDAQTLRTVPMCYRGDDRTARGDSSMDCGGCD